ncbi:extensin-like [Plectropomus leopardus]|uniref:extensin-like n=1 Tax=Plectropomus leopardus TaxID=160734 RepID=UPI001C4B3E4C|nr:extensin-like [Plectropomus leopardus]
MAQYDACHIIQEDGSFVLPLLWRGTPVRMSCPASELQPRPPSVCCSPYGMTVRVQGLQTTEELRVNVRGEWTPLVVLAEQCGYTLDRRDAEIVITAPFVTCGITVKDGKHTLPLQIGERTFTLSCPVSPPEELPLTHQPPIPHHETRGPAEHMPEPLEPFPWAPPFYLAPPYYPHPTNRHKYPNLDGNDAFKPPTPSSSTPEPTFGPLPLPTYEAPLRESYKHFGVHTSLSSTDDNEDSSRVHPDLQQKQETPVVGVSERHGAAHSSSHTSFPIQVEAPLQPPGHAFNPYYHYYHHPKIPLHGAPQDPEPPRGLSLTNPSKYPVLPPDAQQQSEALRRLNSQRLLQPEPEASSHPHAAPTRPPKAAPPHPQHPYPYFYYYPHVARGDVKRLAAFNHNKAAKMNLSDSQNTKSSTFVQPRPRSARLYDRYNLNRDIDQPDEAINAPKNSPELIKQPLLSEDGVKAELDDNNAPVTPAVRPPSSHSPPDLPAFPSPSPDPDLPPHPNHHHPYYHYYHIYYGPSLELQASPSPTASKHQTTSPPPKSMHEIHNGPVHPFYYYYHHYYQPQASAHNHEPLHPAGTERASKSPSDYGGMDLQVHAAEAGYPSIPQPLHGLFHSLNSHYVAQQRLYDPLRRPGGEEEAGNAQIKLLTTSQPFMPSDHLQAAPYTPSAAAPCSLGPVSDSDCSVSLGCCSFPVNDWKHTPKPLKPKTDSLVKILNI